MAAKTKPFVVEMTAYPAHKTDGGVQIEITSPSKLRKTVEVADLRDLLRAVQTFAEDEYALPSAVLISMPKGKRAPPGFNELASRLSTVHFDPANPRPKSSNPMAKHQRTKSSNPRKSLSQNDQEWIEFILDGAAETNEVRSPEITDELLEEIDRYEKALARALEEWSNLHPPKGDAGFYEVWSADAPYNVLMTLNGEGVGIWDGRWDHLYSEGDVRSLTRVLKEKLGLFADDTGGGTLNEAFTEAALSTGTPKDRRGNPKGNRRTAHRVVVVGENASYDAAVKRARTESKKRNRLLFVDAAKAGSNGHPWIIWAPAQGNETGPTAKSIFGARYMETSVDGSKRSRNPTSAPVASQSNPRHRELANRLARGEA